MIQKEELIEYAEYVRNYYGTPKDYVMSQMAAGKDVILEIEIQGAQKIREQFPDALLLFIISIRLLRPGMPSTTVLNRY